VGVGGGGWADLPLCRCATMEVADGWMYHRTTVDGKICKHTIPIRRKTRSTTVTVQEGTSAGMLSVGELNTTALVLWFGRGLETCREMDGKVVLENLYREKEKIAASTSAGGGFRVQNACVGYKIQTTFNVQTVSYFLPLSYLCI
jgi:hypothetical protein